MRCCPIHELFNKANLFFSITQLNFGCVKDLAAVMGSKGDFGQPSRMRNTGMGTPEPFDSLSHSFQGPWIRHHLVLSPLSLHRAPALTGLPLQTGQPELADSSAHSQLSWQRVLPGTKPIDFQAVIRRVLSRKPRPLPCWEFLVVISQSSTGFSLKIGLGQGWGWAQFKRDWV